MKTLLASLLLTCALTSCGDKDTDQPKPAAPAPVVDSANLPGVWRLASQHGVTKLNGATVRDTTFSGDGRTLRFTTAFFYQTTAAGDTARRGTWHPPAPNKPYYSLRFRGVGADSAFYMTVSELAPTRLAWSFELATPTGLATVSEVYTR